MGTCDFDTNKRVIDEVAEVQTKRLRNKIAGFTTHLMKRDTKTNIFGISSKPQDIESNNRLANLSLDLSTQANNIKVDKDTMEMLTAMGMSTLPAVSIAQHRRKCI